MTTRSTPSTPKPPRATVITAAWALTFVAVLLATACAPKTIKLPATPGAPAPDGAEVLAGATTACRAVRTLTAEAAVSGRVGGQKMRGRLSVGVAVPASARIEAVAPFGAPVFIFVATGEDATLLLPRDGRVLEHGRAAAVLDAVSGVPLDPASLRGMLTGCPSETPGAIEARMAGDDWRIVTSGDETIYLNRGHGAAPWQLVAIRRAGDRAWLAEYRDFQDGLPRIIHLATAQTVSGGADLAVALSQVDVNTTLGPDVFRIDVPKGTNPITLEELRRNGPLADRSGAR